MSSTANLTDEQIQEILKITNDTGNEMNRLYKNKVLTGMEERLDKKRNQKALLLGGSTAALFGGTGAISGMASGRAAALGAFGGATMGGTSFLGATLAKREQLERAAARIDRNPPIRPMTIVDVKR